MIPDYGPETPVQIFQHRAEFSKLLELYRERKPDRVLEIGSYHGGTLYHWLQANPSLVVSVDTYTAADNRELYPEWVHEGTELVVVEGDSHNQKTVARLHELKPFDWIFIDAGHYYTEVKEDWNNCLPLVAHGAVICLHDILTHPAHPEIEVEVLWKQIKKMGYETMEIIANKDNFWGGIGVVFL